MRWARHVAHMIKMRNAYSILVGKSERKRPLGRPRRRWEGNNGMDHKEIGLECANSIHLARDRDQWRVIVNTMMNLWVP